jgi:hypothetical protein
MTRYIFFICSEEWKNGEINRGGSKGGRAIGKIMIFWRKIVIFHTKYTKNVRASLRSAQFF